MQPFHVRIVIEKVECKAILSSSRLSRSGARSILAPIVLVEVSHFQDPDTIATFPAGAVDELRVCKITMVLKILWTIEEVSADHLEKRE